MSELTRYVKETKKGPKFRVFNKEEVSDFYIAGLERNGFKEDTTFKGVLEEKEVAEKVKNLNNKIAESVSKKATVVKPEASKTSSEAKAVVKKTEETKEEDTTENVPVDESSKTGSIEDLKNEYQELYDRPVPRSKNKDITWIKSKIDEKKNENN